MSDTNPLLDTTSLPHGAPRFDQITVSHIEPALEAALQKARSRIEVLKANAKPADFDNTLIALETASDELDWVASYFFNLLSAHTSEALQKLAPVVSSKLTEFSSDINLDPLIFERVKAVYDKDFDAAISRLTTEQRRLLEKVYVGFTRNGALLSEEKKSLLRAIDQELSQLAPKFDENILKSVNSYQLHLTKDNEVTGLPDSALESGRAAAKEKDLDGYLFTLHAPSYLPFMTYAERRDLRETLWRAFNSRGYGGETDNRALVRKTVELRQKRAQLLGYSSHADFVLQERMAKSEQNVKGFLDNLRKTYLPFAEKDIQTIKSLATELDGIKDIAPWDVAYYSEKLKKKLFDFDDEQLRPYFSLEKVVSGAFLHAQKLYGLNFTRTDKFPTYHPDVTVYEVTDDNGFVGLFYTDFFPRESKRGGAWMTTYRDQGLWNGKVERPLVAIVCNFTKPVAGKPSLLTYGEVQTLFHEFGHALHGLLSRCTYRSLGGTNVYWDFVELPSQIMENWVQEKESLDLFAEHFETKAKIPQALIDKIKTSSTFFAGYQGLRQVGLGTLDMAWATLSESLKNDIDVDAFEEKSLISSSILPKIPGSSVSTSFSHIFSGGYSAGYYSYKWAEVLDADAFEFFKLEGLFSPKVAQRFRAEILSRGGSEHPAELYRRFRGRDADINALLRRDGLI